jgi:hypothetical protein
MADTREAPANNYDPDVNIPPGVRAAAAAAEAAHKAAYNTETPPAETPPVDLKATSSDTIKLAETPPSADTLPQQITPPAQSAEQPQPPQEEDFERRYKAMKGRHDHLANENRHMMNRLANLEQTLATVTKPPQQEQTDPTLDQITAEELSDYGEDFLALVAKQAKRTLAPTLEELRKQNEQLKAQLGQVGTQVVADAKVKLESYLDTHLTNWRDLNYNEDFLGWLAQPDPYSGATRHSLLKQAYDRNDNARVLAFFNGFLADEAATAPRPSSATNGAGNGHTPPPKVPLERFAAPGRARTTAQVPVEKPVIRRDQIAAFYAKVAAGDYATNEAEKLRLESMIFEAQREGRIT